MFLKLYKFFLNICIGNIEIVNYFDNFNIDLNIINVYIFYFILGKC